MTAAKTVIRAALVAALLVPAATLPALAGPNETAFLQRLVGTWTGKGKVSGPEAGNVACRLTIRPSGERLNFNGRCAFSGGSMAQSFSGRISYNERTGAWESSSQGQTVRGKKNGNNLVFTTTMSDLRGRGSSTMTLSPNGISVQFKVTDSRNGQTSQGSIPFRKG